MSEALIWGYPIKTWLATIAAGVLLYGLLLFCVLRLLHLAKHYDEMMNDSIREETNDGI